MRWTLLPPAVLTLGVVLAGCKKPNTGEQSVDAILDQGSQALAQGDLAAADSAFRNALSVFAHLPEAHLGLARVRRREGKLPEAIAALQETIRMDRTYLEARLELASCYEAAGAPDSSGSTLEQLLHFDPFHADAEYQLARILAARGRRLPARVHLEQAYVLAPNRYRQAYDSMTQGGRVRPTPVAPGEAGPEPGPGLRIPELFEGMELRNVELLASRLEHSIEVRTFTARGMPQSATDPWWTVEGNRFVTALERALEGNPYDLVSQSLLGTAYANRALVHLRNQDAQGALTEYLRALNRRISSPGALRDMAQVEADSQFAAFLLRRAIVLAGTADRDALERLRRLKPQAVPQRLPAPAPGPECLERAIGQARQRWADAEPTLTACIETAPSADWIDGAYALLGRVYYEQRDLERAILFLRRSVEAAPGKWAYYVTLANAVYLTGDRPGAVALGRLALRHADDASTRDMLEQTLGSFR